MIEFVMFPIVFIAGILVAIVVYHLSRAAVSDELDARGLGRKPKL